jgi:hypothetical protein
MTVSVAAKDLASAILIGRSRRRRVAASPIAASPRRRFWRYAGGVAVAAPVLDLEAHAKPPAFARGEVGSPQCGSS